MSSRQARPSLGRLLSSDAPSSPPLPSHYGSESGRKYWATRLSVCPFARTAHSFPCSALLALLALFALLTPALVGK